VTEPRIAAVNFFAQGFVPSSLREEARQVAVPLQFLMQWDDEGMKRQPTLDLFDRLRRQGEDAGTPTWAGTPAPRGSRWTTAPGSSPAT